MGWKGMGEHGGMSYVLLRRKVTRAEREAKAIHLGLVPFKRFTDSAKLLPPQVAFFMNEKRPYIHYINNFVLIG